MIIGAASKKIIFTIFKRNQNQMSLRNQSAYYLYTPHRHDDHLDIKSRYSVGIFVLILFLFPVSVSIVLTDFVILKHLFAATNNRLEHIDLQS